MSDSHRGSKLILSKSIIPVDNNTTFLAHYDITANDVLYGTQPTNNITTMKGLEGKFGGGIAVEEGTTNLSNISYGSSFNNSGNHIRDNNDMTIGRLFDSAPVVSVQMTSGGNTNITTGDATIVGGQIYSLSTWAYFDTVGNENGTFPRPREYTASSNAQIGQLYYIDGYGNSISSFSTVPKRRWIRLVADNIQTTSGNTNLRISTYLNQLDSKIYLTAPQIEQKPVATSFVNGTRANGILEYQSMGIVSGEEGTFSFYINPTSFVPTGSYTDCLDFRTSGNTSNRFLILRKSSGKNTPDQMFIRSGASWITKSITLNPNEWAMLTWSWKNGGNYKMYVNGKLLYSGGYVIGDTDFSKFIFQPVGTIDELRIDSIQRTDEEVSSWYISNQPFYPKGIYRLAY